MQKTKVNVTSGILGNACSNQNRWLNKLMMPYLHMSRVSHLLLLITFISIVYYMQLALLVTRFNETSKTTHSVSNSWQSWHTYKILFWIQSASFKVWNFKDTCRASKLILSRVLFYAATAKKLWTVMPKTDKIRFIHVAICLVY